jgi:effector-binding domain-containing protein
MPGRIEPPQIVHTEDEPYAFISLLIPRSEMHVALPVALKELQAALLAQGLPIKPWFAYHLTLNDGDFDLEACFQVNESFVASGRIQRGLWPAGPVVRTVYQGDYPDLPAAWEELNGWIKQAGYTYAPHIYERYLVSRHATQNPAEFRTEMSWPITLPTTESEPS